MIFQTTATEILVGHTRNAFSISIFNVGYEIKKIIFEKYHRGIPRSKENTKLSTVAGATVLDCRLSMFCLLVCCSFRFFKIFLTDLPHTVINWWHLSYRIWYLWIQMYISASLIVGKFEIDALSTDLSLRKKIVHPSHPIPFTNE